MTGDMKGSHTAATHIRLLWQFVLSAWGPSVALSSQSMFSLPSKEANYREQWLKPHEVRVEYAGELIISILKWTTKALCGDWFPTFVLEDNPIGDRQYFLPWVWLADQYSSQLSHSLLTSIHPSHSLWPLFPVERHAPLKNRRNTARWKELYGDRLRLRQKRCLALRWVVVKERKDTGHWINEDEEQQ